MVCRLVGPNGRRVAVVSSAQDFCVLRLRLVVALLLRSHRLNLVDLCVGVDKAVDS